MVVSDSAQAAQAHRAMPTRSSTVPQHPTCRACGRGTPTSVRVRFGAAFDAATGAAASSTLYLEVPGRHRTPWHTHSAEEVVYVIEGIAEAGIGQRKLRVEAGGLVLIPSSRTGSRTWGRSLCDSSPSSRVQRWSMCSTHRCNRLGRAFSPPRIRSSCRCRRGRNCGAAERRRAWLENCFYGCALIE